MNERKIILERKKSRPLVTCSMNLFQKSILRVFEEQEQVWSCGQYFTTNFTDSL
jgi:hypothetical protein